MKTLFQKKEDVKPKWYIIDGKGKTLGRLATQIASTLLGKDDANFSSHILNKNYVVVTNALEIHLTGQKKENKLYYWHSSYPGGLKSLKYKKLLEKDASKPLYKAVWGMLPKNRSRKKYISHLKIYSGATHNHTNENLKVLNFS